MNQKEDKKSSLSEALFGTSRSEEEVYKNSINQPLWSIDQFSALISGLTPENYKNGSKGSTNISDRDFAKREDNATNICSQYLDYMEKNKTAKDFVIANDQMLLSPWKFIKWAAENKISPHSRFLSSLPLTLIELYLEFQPKKIALRTASKYSRVYHQALYLEHATQLLKEFPSMSPIQAYRHPHMENIRRYIRELGGKYKIRTYVESWLPKIIESRRGRPKKQK